MSTTLCRRPSWITERSTRSARLIVHSRSSSESSDARSAAAREAVPGAGIASPGRLLLVAHDEQRSAGSDLTGGAPECRRVIELKRRVQVERSGEIEGLGRSPITKIGALPPDPRGHARRACVGSARCKATLEMSTAVTVQPCVASQTALAPTPHPSSSAAPGTSSQLAV